MLYFNKAVVTNNQFAICFIFILKIELLLVNGQDHPIIKIESRVRRN